MNRLPRLYRIVGYDRVTKEFTYESNFNTDELESILWSNRLYRDETAILRREVAIRRCQEYLPLVAAVSVASVILKCLKATK